MKQFYIDEIEAHTIYIYILCFMHSSLIESNAPKLLKRQEIRVFETREAERGGAKALLKGHTAELYFFKKD